MNAGQATRYSLGAILLHWLIAVLIVLNFIAAWISEDMPRTEAQQVMANHKAIGLTILALTALRILWRVMHRPPPLAPTLKAWEAALANVTHTLFYLLLLAIPLAGWAMASSFGKGRPIGFFGWFEVPALPVGYDRMTSGIFHEVHETGATLLLALFALHVAAALKHQFLDRDGTLWRMLPGRR